VFDLPVIDAQRPLSRDEPHERADASRNRGRILAAAEQLFACQGVSSASMEAIAAAAGVGKGTLFRRFGDRASLVLAVLDRSEREFQQAFLQGPPPLGPGAPALDRLIAFGVAMLDRLERHGELMLELERHHVGEWQRSAPYSVLWLHVRTLVEQADPQAPTGPSTRLDYLADALLAALSPTTFRHQRRRRGIPLEALQDAFGALATRLAG
jgi:AcrR family transcriptional regulator